MKDYDEDEAFELEAELPHHMTMPQAVVKGVREYGRFGTRLFLLTLLVGPLMALATVATMLGTIAAIYWVAFKHMP
jgi:hypothetical protein